MRGSASRHPAAEVAAGDGRRGVDHPIDGAKAGSDQPPADERGEAEGAQGGEGDGAHDVGNGVLDVRQGGRGDDDRAVLPSLRQGSVGESAVGVVQGDDPPLDPGECRSGKRGQDGERVWRIGVPGGIGIEELAIRGVDQPRDGTFVRVLVRPRHAGRRARCRLDAESIRVVGRARWPFILRGPGCVERILPGWTTVPSFTILGVAASSTFVPRAVTFWRVARGAHAGFCGPDPGIDLIDKRGVGGLHDDRAEQGEAGQQQHRHADRQARPDPHLLPLLPVVPAAWSRTPTPRDPGRPGRSRTRAPCGSVARPGRRACGAGS